MNNNLVFLVEYNDYDIHEICSVHSTVERADQWISNKVCELGDNQFRDRLRYSVCKYIIDEDPVIFDEKKIVFSWEITLNSQRLESPKNWKIEKNQRFIDPGETFKIVSFDNSIIVASFVSEKDCMTKARQEYINILFASGDMTNSEKRDAFKGIDGEYTVD
jgi:hypothetical protein